MNDRYWHNGDIVSKKGFSTDVYFESAIAFMKLCKEEDKPFFVCLATNVPHQDNNVPAEWLKPYLEKKCSREQAAYYAGISRIDWNLGRLMTFLEERQLSGNTILVFMTDNGTIMPLREPNSKIDKVSGMKGKKGDVYEGGHRVPCFIKGPEKLLGAPRDISILTSHVDLLPTFIEICKLKIPAKKCFDLDGRSLNTLLTGNGKWEDRILFLHHRNGLKGPQKYTEAVVIATQWRLILNKLGDYELYNIKQDPSQIHNVIAQHAEVAETLLEKYDAYWDSLGHDKPLERPLLSKHATIILTNGWQRQIRQGVGSPDTWSLKVAEAGTYRFEVRRWPREAGNVAMTADLPPAQDPDTEYIGIHSIDVPGVALKVKAVELQLSGQAVLRKEVTAGVEAVTFNIELPVGNVDLLAQLILADGTKKGAYYVYVTKLSSVDKVR